MGFFSEIDGELKPSEDYLATHALLGYEDGDMEHDDYEIEEDEVAMSLMRKCNNCGKAFTLAGAMKDFDSYFDGEFFYMEEFVGQVCGSCAISELEKEF
ncbi:MAG: hypothetical protein IKW81_10735 [Pseudobutyrivibrio sp.]|nr:hypothetical protein [Pseudobutyrivibrio sp.]